MRSKLLALHLIASLLKSHIYVFTMQTKALSETGESIPFIESIKEFLVMSLSRNATTTVPPVFYVSMDIFGRILVGLRTYLKRELAIFFTEIVLPILEAKKSVSWYQRYLMLKSLQIIFLDPAADGGRILIELYVNYDCNVEASSKENIWERLMNTLAKTLSQHIETSGQFSNSFTLIQPFITQHGNSETPALTTSNLAVLTREQARELLLQTGDMNELKRVVLDFLVRGILNSLVDWADLKMRKHSNGELAKLGVDKSETDKVGVITVTVQDFEEEHADPEAFGNMKLKKQTIIEGVKRFNFKPKKVNLSKLQGMQYLLETKSIPSNEPHDIAKFLLNTEGLSKSMIGEFLGEGYYIL